MSDGKFISFSAYRKGRVIVAIKNGCGSAAPAIDLSETVGRTSGPVVRLVEAVAETEKHDIRIPVVVGSDAVPVGAHSQLIDEPITQSEANDG